MRRNAPTIPSSALAAEVRRALREDVGSGDITTSSLVSRDRTAVARLVSREACVVSGQPAARAVFRALDRSARYRILVPDGARARRGQALATVKGSAGAILTAERTALNFMQRMSGIATLTATFVRSVAPARTAILDTRKTTPGLRLLEKYAVACGGGTNHRMGLFDRALIKDNHRALCRTSGISLAEAIRSVRRKHPGKPVEVEVENEIELRDALRARPDWVLLDNMPVSRMKRCVAIGRGRTKFEASGGVNLRNIRAVASSGVDAVSLGCLTHSAPAIDLSLEIASTSRQTRRIGR
jgi:nicotinate-nucleotide pyrophosphorylase (carboxylating)